MKQANTDIDTKLSKNNTTYLIHSIISWYFHSSYFAQLPGQSTFPQDSELSVFEQKLESNSVSP